MNKLLKYFLCILLSILIVNFIVSTISFASNISQYLIPSKITQAPNNDAFVSLGKEFENSLDDITYDLKETYGDDYPAFGIMYYRTVAHYSSVTIVQNFMFSLIAGFALGNIVFLIFIAKFKSYKLVMLLILASFVTSIFLSLSDILTSIANSEEAKLGLSEIFWNMEITAIPFIIASLVLYGINKIYNVYVEIQNS